jgi:hypothetical protein
MAKIVALVPVTETFKESIIEHLEAYLKDAREGRFVMLAIVGLTRDGDAVHSITAGDDPTRLLGGISRLSHTLNQTIDQYFSHFEPYDTGA